MYKSTQLRYVACTVTYKTGVSPIVFLLLESLGTGVLFIKKMQGARLTMNINRNLVKVMCLAVGAATGSMASAQEGQRVALEEVIVTAQKRAENLQEVPLSISAIGAQELDNRGIESLGDLNAVAPNVMIRQTPELDSFRLCRFAEVDRVSQLFGLMHP